MTICRNEECDNIIPLKIVVDEKKRNLQRRKFCLECSPFGEHNTSPTLGNPIHECPCGETDPNKFYEYRTKLCKVCDNTRNVKKAQDIRKRIIVHMGGCCDECGYDKYEGALDVHHIDSTIKDKTFTSHRFWKWERVAKELENCILLCKNCHAEEHYRLKMRV